MSGKADANNTVRDKRWRWVVKDVGSSGSDKKEEVLDAEAHQEQSPTAATGALQAGWRVGAGSQIVRLNDASLCRNWPGP